MFAFDTRLRISKHRHGQLGKAKGVEAQQENEIVVMFIGTLSVEIEPSSQEVRPMSMSAERICILKKMAVSQMLISRFSCAPVYLSASNKDRFYKGVLASEMNCEFEKLFP
eukprot:94232-Prorocentrum_minimum.AAC.2